MCLQAGEQMGIPLTQQASNESRLSMSESVSEFFDAQEVLLSASSSENEVRLGILAVQGQRGQQQDHGEQMTEEVDLCVGVKLAMLLGSKIKHRLGPCVVLELVSD